MRVELVNSKFITVHRSHQILFDEGKLPLSTENHRPLSSSFLKRKKWKWSLCRTRKKQTLRNCESKT